MGKRYYVGQVVWARYKNYPWWPVEICDSSEPVQEPVPSGNYVFKFAEGSFGFAAPNKLKPLSEMKLQEALNNDQQYNHRIQADYKQLEKKPFTTNFGVEVATTTPKLVVKLSKKTKGVDDYIEVEAQVKKRKLNTIEEDSEDSEDETDDSSTEDTVDPYEMAQILQVYNNKGFLGILEHFGMTFANLKCSLDRMDLEDKTSVAYQIYQNNSLLEVGLKQYMSEFLTSFSTQFVGTFEYYQASSQYAQYLEEQYEEAKRLAEKLSRLAPTEQHEMLLTTPPLLFLPLFRLQNLIQSETHFVEKTYQEYFIMVFKMFPIFSETRCEGIFFKTSESLESDSLRLSLNIMNKKWVENTTRMQPDFVLVRYYSRYKHYFVIGEFENQNLAASIAEEFLCSHKDTLKIILEGRAVLKDIATKFITSKVRDEIKQQLGVMLFLADTSGKVVILKMRPIYHKIQEGLYGIYYELSYSRLLNIFDKTDACTFIYEICNCVKSACQFLYDVDEDSSIVNVCATPITLKSKSEMAKLIHINVTREEFNVTDFEEQDEENLFTFLAEKFPDLVVEKTEVLSIGFKEITIPLCFGVNPNTGSISMYGNGVTEIYGNPIYGCYPIRRNRAVKLQVISLTSFKKIEHVNNDLFHLKKDKDDEHDFKKTSPSTPTKHSQSIQSSNSPHTPQPRRAYNTNSMQDATFKRWGLQTIENKNIHTRTYDTESESLISYIFYGDGVLIDGGFPVFVKIHSGHPMETYNADCVTNYTRERIQADCLDARNTIKIYKYFLEKRSVPYEIFGDISTPCPNNYLTDITISELLIPVENSIFLKTKQLCDNGKLLSLLYVMDGCIRGINFIANHLKLLHNDIAFRNVMIRKSTNKSSISTLLDQYCNFTLTDDVVITDINNCKKIGIALEFENDMKCLAKVFIEFIALFFGKNSLQFFSETCFDGDFKTVYLWIIQTIQSLQKNGKKTVILEFEDVNFLKVIQPLDEMVLTLLP